MIENKKIIRFALFFILSCCLLIPQDAPAQYRQAHTVVHSSIFFQTWKITEDGSEKKLTQWALPFFLSRTFGSRLQLMLAESNAISLLDLPDGAKWPSQDPLSFGGIGDTKIKLSYGLVPNKLLITSGLSLPTGKNALSIPESKIFRQFSSETLAFRVGKLGQGLEGSIGLVGMHEMGPVTIGGGGSYLARGAYKQLDISEEAGYKPGNQYNGVFSAGLKMSEVNLRSTVILTQYEADQFFGQKEFQQGMETMVDNRISYQGVRSSASAFIRQTIRNRNRFMQGEELAMEEKNYQGMGLMMGLNVGYRLSRFTEVRGMVEHKRKLANDFGQGRSQVSTISLGMMAQLKRDFALQIDGQFSQGWMKDEAVSIQGLGATTTLTMPF